MKHAQIIARLFNQPLAVHPERAFAMVQVLGPRLGLDQTFADQFDVADRFLQSPNPSGTEASVPGARRGAGSDYIITENGIAVILVAGTLVHRAAAANPPSSLWSYGEIRDMYEDAITDPSVRGVLLDIDSPGGEVSGAFDLSDLIFATRDIKPVWAVADEMAASAAYAIASAASRVIVPRTGIVGSIGVIAMHMDASARDEAEGFKFTPIFAGARKIDLSPHFPLSNEAAERVQESVDRTYGLFTSTVGRNRGARFSADKARATEAGLFEGMNGVAVEAGLADDVMSFHDALAALSEHIENPQRTISISPAARSAAHVTAKEQEEPIMSDAEKKAAKQAAETDDAPNTDGKVVDIEKARADARGEGEQFARDEAQKRATDITALCNLASMPEKAGDFITGDLSVEAVRDKLQEAKAAADSTPTDGTQPVESANVPTVDSAAIYRRRNAAHGIRG